MSKDKVILIVLFVGSIWLILFDSKGGYLYLFFAVFYLIFVLTKKKK